jgi:hypothetical protein
MSNLQLKNITLLSYNCVNPIQSVKALLYSSRKIDFARIVLVSNKKPDNLPSHIEFVKTDLKTHLDGSKFTYTELPSIIKTDYYIGIHDDGFIINPHLWTDEFLKYDYIGAPWKWEGRRNRVGNGGFVLKSNKFIQLTKNLKFLNVCDDGELTNMYYDYFVENGCKYAPVHVAMKFSLESKIPECDFDLNKSFGFHGKGRPQDIQVHDGEYQQFQDRIKLLEIIKL